ncbi:phytanoyl-CoA dioxygenase family protein [Paenibacillus koleovorans]|uniref:phytanoyl-CoA dioxygenase family protein n=1 Tax=Paenibacillus koleovorans TaxID=121608 RepID=UPI000FD7A857|nr:phytanoyl-CoA dioxygenase family protein [Paenibacillus koleovorans]
MKVEPNSAYSMLVADAAQQDCITEEQKQFFLDNGFLVVRGVLRGEELDTIQRDMLGLIEARESGNPTDYMYGKGVKSGKDVLRRIEYVIDKCDSMKVLLGHPFILRSVELLQGRNFIPTWDSMVLKMPDEGVIVPWHRDGETELSNPDDSPIFNVDFYLDDADLSTCLWVIPGSNGWSPEEVKARCARPGFDTSDAVPVPMQAGDVILHHVKVLHGSPSGDGNPLRRTVYYEFRPGEVEYEHGPHTREYLPLKQQVLLHCLDRRREASYAAGERPFEYRPDGRFAVSAKQPIGTYRYPHGEYWRQRE